MCASRNSTSPAWLGTPPGGFVELEDRLFVVIAFSKERLVDQALDPPPGRLKGDRGQKSASQGDGGLRRGKKLDRKIPKNRDPKQINAGRENGQQRIDKAAVDDNFDVQKPEPEYRQCQSQRGKYEKDRHGVLSQRRAESENPGDLIQEDERRQAQDEAQENPFDLGPALLEGRSPIGLDESENGQQKKGHQISAKHGEQGRVTPEDGRRQPTHGEENQHSERAAEEQRGSVNDGERQGAALLQEGEREMDKQGRGQGVEKVEQHHRHVGRPAAPQTVGASVDDHAQREDGRQPIEDSRLPIFPTEQKDERTDKKT
jgi:hypothetical protein